MRNFPAIVWSIFGLLFIGSGGLTGNGDATICGVMLICTGIMVSEIRESRK